jgi:hypothetical protein
MKATTPPLILATSIIIGSVIMSTGMIIAADKIYFSVKMPDALSITLLQSKYSEPFKISLGDKDTATNIRLWPPTEQKWSNDGQYTAPIPFPIKDVSR